MKQNGRPDAVLFDLDGTLVATKSLYIEAYRTAIEPFVRRGITGEDILALKPTSELALIRAVVDASEVDACVQGFYRAYRDLHPSMFEGVYPGIPELLAAVRRARLPVGIVTGKSRRCWEVTSAAAALGPFDVLVFDDDVRAPKPDPHGIELALERLGVSAGRAVYVGDTMTDLRAATAAGLRAITVLWARAEEDREELARQAREGGATAVVERPAELERLLHLT
jgi:pyrophosphatase PpaX